MMLNEMTAEEEVEEEEDEVVRPNNRRRKVKPDKKIKILQSEIETLRKQLKRAKKKCQKLKVALKGSRASQNVNEGIHKTLSSTPAPPITHGQPSKPMTVTVRSLVATTVSEGPPKSPLARNEKFSSEDLRPYMRKVKSPTQLKTTGTSSSASDQVFGSQPTPTQQEPATTIPKRPPPRPPKTPQNLVAQNGDRQKPKLVQNPPEIAQKCVVAPLPRSPKICMERVLEKVVSVSTKKFQSTSIPIAQSLLYKVGQDGRLRVSKFVIIVEKWGTPKSKQGQGAFLLHVSSNDTFGEVKKKIQKLKDTYIHHQILRPDFFSTKNFEDHQKLGDAHVGRGTTIFLHILKPPKPSSGLSSTRTGKLTKKEEKDGKGMCRGCNGKFDGNNHLIILCYC